eukprot:TRINITY_DN4471_c3_g3_i1.p1 TRINITY_DN4471_c3_g3~~TRINITY_DN4471_c3_g3_i1.p1  ORF type:complete len:688 (+),score=77.30 TRINITY_DN4471_c3_g3_i1:38-2065(+)
MSGQCIILMVMINSVWGSTPSEGNCTVLDEKTCLTCSWNEVTKSCAETEEGCERHKEVKTCIGDLGCTWNVKGCETGESVCGKLLKDDCEVDPRCVWEEETDVHLCVLNGTLLDPCRGLNKSICYQAHCKWEKQECKSPVHCYGIKEPECHEEDECKWEDNMCLPKPEGCEEESPLEFYILTTVIICAFVGVRAVQKLNWSGLSESGGVIIVGVLIGAVLWAIQEISGHKTERLIAFDEEIFSLFILPPIIFEAGFTLEHKGVMKNLGTILLYAVFGTLISSLIIGVLVYFISQLVFPELADHPGAPFISMAFGALLSAVDPVAVIAVLGQKFDLSSPPLLYNLVFGEAVLNDAVSIVLYRVMIKFVDVEMNPKQLALALWSFTFISVASCILGWVYGALCALLLKHVDFKHHPAIEIIMLGAFAMGSYYLAETFHLSGIMSLFICARIEGYHAMWNLSQEAREAAVFIFKTLAHLAETYVFILLGEAFWDSKHEWNVGFIAMVYVAMLVARAVNIFPLSALANRNRKQQKVTGKMQFFMWFSGLRGAIAFGLALLTLTAAEKNNGDHPDKNISENIARVFVSTTLVMVIITVLIMGAFTEFILSRLELTAPEEVPDKEIALVPMNSDDPDYQKLREATEKKKKQSVHAQGGSVRRATHRSIFTRGNYSRFLCQA